MIDTSKLEVRKKEGNPHDLWSVEVTLHSTLCVDDQLRRKYRMTEELTKELEEEVRALLHRHIYGDILELARNLERKLMGSMPYYMDENLRKQVDELIDGLKYHGKKNHETNTTST